MSSRELPAVDVWCPCGISIARPVESYCSLGPQLAGVRRDQHTPQLSPGHIVTQMTVGAYFHRSLTFAPLANFPAAPYAAAYRHVHRAVHRLTHST